MRMAILTTDNREHYKDYSARAPCFGTAPEALLQGLALLPEVEVHVVSCIREKVTSPDRLASNIYFHSLLVPKIGWIRTGYQGCIRATRAKLKEVNPRVVHAQGTERDCAISAVFSGFPNVVTLHGNMRRVAQVMHAKPFSYLWLAARLERYTLPKSGGVVCITRHTLNEVQGLAKRTWVVPNAVDPSFFDVPRHEAPDAPLVLCVGQIYSLKNQVALIRALDPLAPSKEFTLEFLGEAKAEQPYAAEFLKLVSERPWCVHAGFADRAKLKERLSRASLLAQVSLEDNCPMAVLEAMAAGVPVLASKVGGLPDLVTEGKTGWFCDPHDQESIRAAFTRFASDATGAIALGKTAREEARERFHPRRIAEKHVAIYRELAGGPR